jgi:hypothetical protein
VGRTTGAIALLTLLSLSASSGCASWRARNQTDRSSTSSYDNGGQGDIFQDALQGVSDASFNNWDFKKSGLW